jgi:hypothetical protein
MNLDLSTAIQLSGELGIASPIPNPNDQATFDWLADIVAQMLDSRREYLMQALYRLDVDERKVAIAFEQAHQYPLNIQIAQLLVERQLERARTKAAYKPPTQTDWAAEL